MKDERKTLILTSLSHGLAHALMTAFPGIMPNFRALGFDLAWLGRANFIHRLLFGTGVLPAGVLVDRIGAKRVLLVFLFGASLVALAGGVFLQPASVILLLVGIGAFASLYHSSGMSIVSYRKSGHGRAFGFHGIGGTLGEALSPLICNLLASAVSWKAPYILLGAVTFAVACVVLMTPLRWEVAPPEEGGSSGSGETSQGMARVATSESPQATRLALADESTWRDALFCFLPTYLLFGLAYTGFITFLPTALSGELGGKGGFLKNWPGFWASACLLAGIPGQWIGGRIADRWKLERAWFFLLSAATPALVGLWLFSGWWVLLPGVLFAFFYMTAQPINNSLFAKYASPTHRGRVYGLGFFFYFGVGSLASELGGRVGKAWGLKFFFLILAGATLAGGILAYFLARRVAKSRDDASGPLTLRVPLF